MTLLQVVVLAIIQGLTEFLPVSSSAHLIFPSQILGWPDQGLAFDVSVHVGTLVAVIIYYLADLVQISTHVIEATIRRRQTPISRVGFCLIIATIPVCVFGLLFQHDISTVARSIHVIAYTTIGFGLLLGLASYVNRHLVWRTIINIEGERADTLRHLTFQQALIVGFAQALAIVPGTSRSGITLTAGLFLGMRPEAAARFSFLLAIPVILASGLFEGLELLNSPEAFGASNFTQMSLGAVISFLIAILVIHFFMKFIAKSGMAIFVIYRVLLGLLLLWMF
ncbi:MAG: undecaprenyl-diphosphate phosphatase [Succinivibrio sp.]|nr:undecaprenyl-diphosphate phosphatase [Succinivibrio sp.]